MEDGSEQIDLGASNRLFSKEVMFHKDHSI